MYNEGSNSEDFMGREKP